MTAVQRAGSRLLRLFATPCKLYNETAQKHPASTGIITTLLKTSAADAFAQMVRVNLSVTANRVLQLHPAVKL